MTIKTLLAGAAAGALATFAFSPAFAAGFLIQEQAARGAGRAYSGEAADTGAASLWWNPAAIGAGPGVGDFSIGAHYIDINADIADDGSTIQRPVPGLPAQPVGGVSVESDAIKKGVVPNLGASWRVGDQFAFGVAVNAPFNFTTRYPLNSWTRYQALKSSLFNIDVQPTVAWRPTPQVTIGAGFDFSYVRATLSNALPNPSPVAPDAGQVLTGKGWDHGFVVGGQFMPDPNVTVGVSYRSRITHNLNGGLQVFGLLGPAAAANFSAPATAEFRTPSILTGAVRFKATPALTLEAQVQHYDWSVFDAISVSFAGQTAVTPQTYRDTTSVAVGADYALNPQMTLRAGVQRDPTPTPDPGRTARVPDGDRWLISGGATIAATPGANIDVAVSYLAFDSDRINSRADAFTGTPLATPIAMSGTISGHGLIVAGGLRFNY
jgi:long-chain fatty acid transport protein